MTTRILKTEHDHTPHVALVLCGGGAKGAIEVGFYRALCELGVPIHRVIGTSVGAVNGAFIAAGTPARRLARGWAELRRRDVLRFQWSLLWRGLAAESVYTSRRLRRLLERHLPARTFAELPIPLSVVATDLQEGTPVAIESGDLVEAILASSAVPGLLPPVQLQDGRRYIDGALTNNMPVDLAYAKGATAVFAIVCSACARCAPRRGLGATLGQAFGIVVDCKFRLQRGEFAKRDNLCLIEEDLGMDVPALDFGHGRELMRRAYALAKPRLAAWLRAHPEVPSRFSPGSAPRPTGSAASA